MAEIQPFKGIHYDWSKVAASDVVAPPYDVIDADEQDALYALSPHNVIQLILNKNAVDGDNNRYDDAAAHFNAWREDGTLVQDPEDAVYVYHQSFEVDGETVTRRGFMARVKLHPYEDRVILPHEQTLRGPKVDRLRLNETVGANLSQVFFLYDDPEQQADAALSAALAEPTVELTTQDGIQHTIYTVTDPAVIATVQAVLKDQALLIADGHHRYETNLALRDRAQEAGTLTEDDPRRYVLAYLANGADPGLLVWPTHRVVHGVEGLSVPELIGDLAKEFSIKKQETVDVAQLAERVLNQMQDHIAFGLIGEGNAYLVTRPRSEPSLVPHLTPDALQKLDLSVLHEVILKNHIGMTEEDFSKKTYLRYVKSVAAAKAELDKSDTQLVVLVNHSPVSEVREVCVAGGKMPQKSTYFYPKVLSGLVFHGHK